VHTRKHILDTLRGLKPELARYKAQEVGVFGSCARAEQTEASDVDLLVEFAPGAGLFDLVALGDFLEQQLHRRVDIVTTRALREEMRSQVMRELVPV